MSNGYVNGQPDVSWWISQVRLGLEYRKKWAYESKWPLWRSYYRGNFSSGILPINLYFKMLRMLVPRLYFRNPSVSITPTRPGPEQMALAQMLERMDNKLIHTMQLKKAMKNMIQRTWLYGTSYGKLGYGSQYAYDDSEMQSGTDRGGNRPSAALGKERLEYSSVVQDGMPWFMSGKTGQFIVPAGTCEFSDARWMAEWLVRPLEDVQRDPRLKNTRNLKATKGFASGSLANQLQPNNPEYRDDQIDLLVIRDSKYRKVIVLAPFATDRLLLFADDPLQTDRSMGYFTLVFNTDDEVCWGLPDAKILEPQQLEMNESRTQLMKHRRATLVKLLHEVNSVDEDELQKMTSEEVLAAVKVKDINKVKPLQVADIPQSLFLNLRQIEDDVREQLGFSRNQFGDYAQGSADRSATEASIVKEASEIRIDERRDAMADLMIEVMADTNRIVFERWSEEEVAQVVGPQGQMLWVAFKPSMLKDARYLMKIDPDSAVPETRDRRQQKATVVYRELKTNPLIDPEKLTRYYLTGIGDPEMDDMMRSMGALQPGVGQNPGQPMQMGQYVNMLASGGGGPQPT